MNPYRSTEAKVDASKTTRKGGGGAAVLFLIAIGGLPVMLHGVEFPHHAINVLVWIAMSVAGAISAIYTFVLMLVCASHMTPKARAENQHRSPGIFDAENYDEAGQALRARFVRAFATFVLIAVSGGVLGIVFPL